MQAFRVDFVASRIGRGLALGYAALLVGAVCVYFSGSLKWGLLAAIAACGAWAAWRKPRYDVKRLMVDNQGFAAVFIGDEAFAAQPISGCLATRWACFIHWQTMDATFWQCMFYDATDAAAFRQLRLWLEYGQPTRAQIKRRTGMEIGVRKPRKGMF